MEKENDNHKVVQKPRKMPSPLSKRLYDLKEAAGYLARPVYSVRTLIWNGKIPVIKEGRKMYLDVYDMDAYIEWSKERMI